MNRILITRMAPIQGAKETVVSALVQGDKLAEVVIENPSQQSVLKNIYVGRVQSIVQNINAAFIEYRSGCVGYYTLDELSSAIFTKKQGRQPLTIGDELLVQVQKEAMKTKAAVLSTNLNFIGKYVVLTTGRNDIGLSGKLNAVKKQELKELVASAQPSCGVIVRTNAGEADPDQLLYELKAMEDMVERLLHKAPYLSVFSNLLDMNREYIQMIRNAYTGQMEEIVTDDAALYQEIRSYLEEFQPQDADRLRWYEDALLPLPKLYSLQTQIETALKKHVWLKSGAYLIIEQTEAFTVMDVNTGKFDGKKSKKDTFLKINLEAAREAARQMRLRNLSGIILIDFINMQEEADNQRLMEELAACVKKDRIQTLVVDMTALGIVEVTRKKERCCLQEAVRRLNT